MPTSDGWRELARRFAEAGGRVSDDPVSAVFYGDNTAHAGKWRLEGGSVTQRAEFEALANVALVLCGEPSRSWSVWADATRREPLLRTYLSALVYLTAPSAEQSTYRIYRDGRRLDEPALREAYWLERERSEPPLGRRLARVTAPPQILVAEHLPADVFTIEIVDVCRASADFCGLLGDGVVTWTSPPLPTADPVATVNRPALFPVRAQWLHGVLQRLGIGANALHTRFEGPARETTQKILDGERINDDLILPKLAEALTKAGERTNVRDIPST